MANTSVQDILPKYTDGRHPINIRVSKELFNAVLKVAQERDRIQKTRISIPDIVREALEIYVMAHESSSAGDVMTLSQKEHQAVSVLLGSILQSALEQKLKPSQGDLFE